MVYLKTVEEWQKQSALLLQARPTTARITTKYNIPHLESTRYRLKEKSKSRTDGSAEKQESSSAPRTPRATLTLKTYDPTSGVVLKFKTDRAADIGRLVAGLGVLGRNMAALPEKKSDVDDKETLQATERMEIQRTATESEVGLQSQPAVSGGGGGGSGGKKKKKGKR